MFDVLFTADLYAAVNVCALYSNKCPVLHLWSAVFAVEIPDPLSAKSAPVFCLSVNLVVGNAYTRHQECPNFRMRAKCSPILGGSLI
jgi:hypothetical protein